MKKNWKDFLPPALRDFLRQTKVKLRRITFRVLNTVFACCPIQSNKIVFDNYICKGYGCNPKYVAQKLIECGAADYYDLVWIVSRDEMEQSEIPPQIRRVPSNSPASFLEYATAKLWVSNYHKIPLIKNRLSKHKGQFFIQMWHGSLGIKKIDNDVPALRTLKRWLPASIKSSGMVDYWISNSSFETAVYKSAFNNVKDESILLYGHPRNDIFFDAATIQQAYRKVVSRYGLDGKHLLLYAPTFREEFRKDGEIDRYTDRYALDYPALLASIKRRFGGDWAILIRHHPRLTDPEAEAGSCPADIIDVTHYADMQELLAATDCLITDYSSCAFDFMLTRRPVFLFAADIQEFDMKRGFYYPLETTPFPLAHNNRELMKNIDEFHMDSYSAKVDRFLREKGCMEDGHASERVAELIIKLMKQDA